MNSPAINTQAAPGTGSGNPCQPVWKRQRGDAAVKAAYVLDVVRR